MHDCHYYMHIQHSPNNFIDECLMTSIWTEWAQDTKAGVFGIAIYKRWIVPLKWRNSINQDSTTDHEQKSSHQCCFS